MTGQYGSERETRRAGGRFPRPAARVRPAAISFATPRLLGLRLIAGEEVNGIQIHILAVVVVVPDGLRVAVSAHHLHLSLTLAEASLILAIM